MTFNVGDLRVALANLPYSQQVAVTVKGYDGPYFNVTGVSQEDCDPDGTVWLVIGDE